MPIPSGRYSISRVQGEIAGRRQHWRQEPVGDESADDKRDTAAPGDEADTDRHQRQVPDTVHVVGQTNQRTEIPVGHAGAYGERLHGRTDDCRREQ
jgi:hypothetical protein